MAEIINKELVKAILDRCWKDEKTGRNKISLGNCRLDFSKTYFLNGFTERSVKLSWENGDKEINILGRIERRHDYYALYTEGWDFIEHINRNEVQEKN